MPALSWESYRPLSPITGAVGGLIGQAGASYLWQYEPPSWGQRAVGGRSGAVARVEQLTGSAGEKSPLPNWWFRRRRRLRAGPHAGGRQGRGRVVLTAGGSAALVKQGRRFAERPCARRTTSAGAVEPHISTAVWDPPVPGSGGQASGPERSAQRPCPENQSRSVRPHGIDRDQGQADEEHCRDAGSQSTPPPSSTTGLLEEGVDLPFEGSCCCQVGLRHPAPRMWDPMGLLLLVP